MQAIEITTSKLGTWIITNNNGDTVAWVLGQEDGSFHITSRKGKMSCHNDELCAVKIAFKLALAEEDRCDDCNEIASEGLNCPDGTFICYSCFENGAH